MNGEAGARPLVRCAIVLRVAEQSCDVWLAAAPHRARYAPQFPSPRTQRVSPGHLVAVATAPDDALVVVWR